MQCLFWELSWLLPKTGLYFVVRICLGQIIFLELLPSRQPSQQSLLTSAFCSVSTSYLLYTVVHTLTITATLLIHSLEKTLLTHSGTSRLHLALSTSLYLHTVYPVLYPIPKAGFKPPLSPSLACLYWFQERAVSCFVNLLLTLLQVSHLHPARSHHFFSVSGNHICLFHYSKYLRA